MASDKKNVYVFGAARTDGDAKMKNLLGGKGANLAEMCRLGIRVPSGFTISTEVCTVYTQDGADAVKKLIEAEVLQGVAFVESEMGKRFGDASDPLLLSVRSGSRASMPGMMDTILNLGLNDEAVAGLARKTGNERFAWDSYRRFVQMYGDVVMGLKPVTKEEHDPFEVVIDAVKDAKGVKLDTELGPADLKELVQRFKALIRASTGRDFPTDPWEQLWGAVMAVFQSWNNDRAKVYRELNDIPDSWGTAVNVQAMVFGNLGRPQRHRRRLHARRRNRRGPVQRRVPGQRAGRGRRRRHPHAAADHARGLAALGEARAGERGGAAREVPVARGADARHLPAAAGGRDQARAPLPRHAGRRVHDPGGQPLDAADPQRQAHRRGDGADRDGDAAPGHDRRKGGAAPRQPGAAQRAPAPDLRPDGDQEGALDRARPAGVAGRRHRADRVLRRRGRGLGAQGQAGDPGAPGDLARGPARHERRQGHPHRARRHDLARGRGRARHGQVLRVRVPAPCASTTAPAR